ncbi:hypothetical protein LTR85_000125 [Meristemomyces frigidus]|nr:hypothetical protein LTR85_000125 [Meristemomyces frigidus]
MSGMNGYPGGPIPPFSDDATLQNLLTGSDFSTFGGSNDMNFDFSLDSNTGGTISPADLSSTADFDQFLTGPSIPQEVQPMRVPSPAPAMMPAGPPGAHFHPDVGWFYPAATSAAYPPPALPMSALPTNEGFMPMAPPAQMLQAPQPQRVRLDDYYGKTQQKPKANQWAQGNKRKQYFGPAAHFGLDAASQKRDAADADLDDEPPSKKTKRATKPTKAAVPALPTRGKPASIEMACVCATGTKAPSGIKRPKNSFIIYRMQQQKQIQRELDADPTTIKTKNGHVRHDLVSREAGRRWKAMGESEKAEYVMMAQNEAQLHKELYPNYKYDPKGKGLDANFGTPDCKCGAYQANLAKAKCQRGSEDFGDDDLEPEVLDDYVPPRSAATYSAPTAQMSAQAPMLPDVMPAFGFSTPAQRVEAANHFRLLKAQQNAAPVSVKYIAPPVRRSSRNHANVTYTEPSDIVDGDDDDFEAQMTAQLSEALNAPSPQLEGMPKRRPSAISTPFNSPPAHNTRARSRASLDLPTIPEGEGLADFGDLFGENGDFNGDFNYDEFLSYDNAGADADMAFADNDNIVVAGAATRRSSSRKSSKSSPKMRSSPRRNPGSPQGIEKRRTSSDRSTRSTRRSPRRS